MSIERKTWFGVACASTVALVLGAAACSSSGGGTQPGTDSGSGTDATTDGQGDDSSSLQDSGQPPADSSANDADSSSPSDSGGNNDSATDSESPVDSGTVDSGSPVDSGPVDSASPVDSGNPVDSGSPIDSGGTVDSSAPIDSGSSADTGSPADGGCSGSTPVALTVYNFKAWCALTVAGTAISPGTLGHTTKTDLCVAADTDISATANGSAFEIGTPPLPFISGTNTVTDNGTTASTTLASGATCVFACCPFTGGGGCSGLTNPCP